MKQYLDLLKIILENGVLIPNRTGINAYAYPHMMIRHDMSDGFPLLTTKKMAWESIKVELEFFIKGLTDKKWLQERGCHIWDEWSDPTKIPPGLSDKERKKVQFDEPSLGKIYGYQWRNFNSQGTDQLRWIINELKTNPNNRQLVCSAWNPIEKEEQALPPCHFAWSVFMIKDRLNLSWNQRSADFFLGIPFNMASYALLLHLLCLEIGCEEGVLSGFMSNCHIYENHISAVKEQLERIPFELSRISTNSFKSIFQWEYRNTDLINYQYHPSIKADIAV